MADHIIEVRVDDKIATVVGDPLYVCGNSDYVVKFAFDAEWADHAMKTARFIKSNKEYIDVVFNSNECQMPIIADTAQVRIGVFAGNLCTTTAAIVNAQRSILCGSGVPAEKPEPNVYTQIMERINGLGVPDLNRRVDALQSNAVIAQHVRGDMLHIEDAAAWQAEKVVTHIEPKQEGSGDPSPDNIRPISGWEEVTLTRQDEDGSNVYISQFEQAVYGGEYNWKTGKLTITHGVLVLTGEEPKWEITDGGNDYFMLPLGEYGSLKDGCVCSHYRSEAISAAVIAYDVAWIIDSSAYKRVHLSLRPRREVATTIGELKAYLTAQYAAGTPVQVCYELTAPREIQLTPQQMPEMLKGVNNVWCDTGETEMVYIADNQLYIDQKIGESTAALNAIMEGINNV